MTDFLPILLEIKEDVGATRACVTGLCASHEKLEARVASLEAARESRNRQVARLGGMAAVITVVVSFLATNMDKVARAFQ